MPQSVVARQIQIKVRSKSPKNFQKAEGMRQTPKMGGSTSIKRVLPALVPNFENVYKDLELVHKGQEAMAIYAQMPGMPQEPQGQAKKALLAYCKPGTLAMVQVLKALREKAHRGWLTPLPKSPWIALRNTQ